MAVGAIDLINRSLSVPRAVPLRLAFVCNWSSVVMGLWAMRILKGCRIREVFSDMPIIYCIVAVVVGVVVSFVLVVVL